MARDRIVTASHGRIAKKTETGKSQPGLTVHVAIVGFERAMRS